MKPAPKYYITDKFCLSCGHVGHPKTHTKGSFGVELLLWLFLLIPGFVYSAWRLSTRGPVCKKCTGASTIPIDSPIVQKTLREIELGNAREV